MHPHRNPAERPFKQVIEAIVGCDVDANAS
jgi:hypothetical protein